MGTGGLLTTLTLASTLLSFFNIYSKLNIELLHKCKTMKWECGPRPIMHTLAQHSTLIHCKYQPLRSLKVLPDYLSGISYHGLHLLDAFSVTIRSNIAAQLYHWRDNSIAPECHPSVLVLPGQRRLDILRHGQMGTELSHDVSEPALAYRFNWRTAKPWDRIQQDAMSDIEGVKPPPSMWLWGRSACYPQGNFYPFSDGISTHAAGSLT